MLFTHVDRSLATMAVTATMKMRNNHPRTEILFICQDLFQCRGRKTSTNMTLIHLHWFVGREPRIAAKSITKVRNSMFVAGDRSSAMATGVGTVSNHSIVVTKGRETLIKNSDRGPYHIHRPTRSLFSVVKLDQSLNKLLQIELSTGMK